MAEMQTADVIVVGLGAFGAATLLRLARRGVRVLGIDRNHPPHDQGSSHGESRITRLAVGEGAAFAPFVRRSHALWREMEQETGQRLMLRTGGLVLSPRGAGTFHHGTTGFVQTTIAVAERFGIAHEVLDAAGIEARFPQFILRGDEVGYFEPEAGMLFPETCIAAQLDFANRAGAAMRIGETVRDVAEDAAGVTVTTDMGRYAAGKAVLTAGAWLPELLGGALAPHLRVHRQVLQWFPPDEAASYAPGRFPVFIWIHGDRESDSFYGLPMLEGSTGIKLATEHYDGNTTPETVDRTIAPAYSADVHARHVAGHLRGIGAHATQATTCLYTVTPDASFIVDRAPGYAHVHVVSACSGHGFKHSAAMGEAIAAMVLGEAVPSLEPFALARFGVNPASPAAPH